MKTILLSLLLMICMASGQSIVSLAATNYTDMGLTYSNICRNTNYMYTWYEKQTNLISGYSCDVSTFVQIRFTTISNRMYQVLHRAQLEPYCTNVWCNINYWNAVSPPIRGDGTTHEFHHGVYNFRGFYKIVFY